MNAYELADLIDSEDTLWLEGRLVDICNMLRQQADRIAELEKSAEPVAWTNQKWLDGIAREPQLFQPLFVHGKQTEHNTIPLYITPQIKELSDEEIIEIGNAVVNLIDSNEGWIEFAKAILKKASEK
jgi:predicted component of type VI protein secretion system